jgi:hypothetical protein
MEPREVPKKSRFKIDKLEERIAPAHLGVREIAVPAAAGHGAQGLETANETPTHETPTGAVVPHSVKKIILFD